MDLEGIDIRVMRGLVVIQHQIDGVCRGANEDDLEGGVVEGAGVESGPEEVCKVVCLIEVCL